ncbi:MAG: (Fe-S)-binding protein [Candidatus Bathyarchaeia archaeon]
MSLPFDVKDLSISVLTCVRCRGCIWTDLPELFSICPSYEKYGFYAFSGSGKISVAKAIVLSSVQFDKSVADVFYKCTMCGACQENCSGPFGKKLFGENYLRKGFTNLVDIIQFIREQLVERGIVLSEHKSFIKNTIKFGNPFVPNRERLKWTESLNFKIKDLMKENAEVLFYPGCMYSLEPQLIETTRRFAQVLQTANVDYGFLGESEICCGAIQLQLGERGLFEEIAKNNIETLNSLGIEKLVTPCPHCYYALKELCPKVATINFEVTHITQFLNRLIQDGQIKLITPLDLTVTYHDPCNLSRFTRTCNEPRKILAALKGVETIEMPRTREQTWCCGAGGGVMVAYPEFMRWTANERIKEAEATGSSTLVTACPWCEYSFKQVLSEEKHGITLKNIIELLWDSMTLKLFG